MLLVDSRRGSKEFLPMLRDLRVDAKIATLDSADFAFEGNGPTGKIRVGIERKTIGDLVSSANTGRLGTVQLPKLLRDYGHWWILLEGQFRPARAGDWIEIPGRGTGRGAGGWKPAPWGMTYYALVRRIVTLQVVARGMFWRTLGQRETAKAVAAIYRWYTADWKAHKSHLPTKRGFLPEKVLMIEPTWCRKFAAGLPGLGWEKSGPVAQHFKSIGAAVNSDVEDWAKAGVGSKLAEKLIKVIWTDDAR